MCERPIIVLNYTEVLVFSVYAPLSDQWTQCIREKFIWFH